jgi:hypothetical protein
MRFWVDAWDPSYATAVDEEESGPARESTAQLNLDVEVPAAAWAAMPAPPDLRAPDTVLLVDGVRRRDAVVWTAEQDGSSHPGLAVSYAAGVVRCDLRRGEATLAGAPAVRRGLFTASPTATGIDCGRIRYDLHRSAAGDLTQLSAGVQGPLSTLEVEVASAARSEAGAGPAGGHPSGGDPGDLLVVDGPLRDRRHLARTVGYIKTHRRRYLPPDLVTVVTGLPPGHRSPVFLLGTSWHRYTWYLRLPGGSGAPWSGLVRVEAAAELPVTGAVALADLSAVTLPRFAATAYKDARAPQNLVPIAGLEHRLRALLGDALLLHRALLRGAAASSPAPRSELMARNGG